MAEESILTDDFLRELMNVGEVDVLVGVPTYNDAKTVGQVVQAVRTGLLKYFPRQRAVIINADGGSRDATQELVRAASISDMQHVSNLYALRTLHCISTQYPGNPARGKALHTILAAADLLHANVCAVISPDSVNIEPEWMERLLAPVVRQNIDLVTPIYCRHKFDGLLIKNLVYPMTRALYCKRVREPHPAEYAFSGRLGSHLLEQDIWTQEIGLAGAETYAVISAMTNGFQLAQSFLGPKSHAEQAPADLVPALQQTAGVVFWSMEKAFPSCSTNPDQQAVLTMGPENRMSLDPLRVNRKRLHQMFVRGVAELHPVLSSLLSSETLGQLQILAGVPEEDFRYNDSLWVRTVYEFAASYHKEVISRDHVVQALAPLYRGKAYTFLTENREANADEIEQNIEALCLTFEQEKNYLIEMWNGRK